MARCRKVFRRTQYIVSEALLIPVDIRIIRRLRQPREQAHDVEFVSNTLKQ